MNIHKTHTHLYFVFLITIISLVACGSKPPAPTLTTVANSEEIQVIITCGYDTDPRDKGRPVVLIASVLGVPPEVFREAFSHVQPAGAGQEPEPAQVKENKEALMNVLGPYGVTNELLDTVSNYYRYNGSAGETWTQIPAIAEAIVTDGVVTGFVITNPGSGYTSTPVITVSGSDVKAIATISFTTDFKTNGSLTAINIANP